jgi:hypothetical protein
MANNKWRGARIGIFALAPMGPWGGILSIPAEASGLFAPDAVALTGGYGGNVAVYGGALTWKLPGPTTVLVEDGFGAHLVAHVAYWRGNGRPTPNGSLWDTSLTPMLRWTNRSGSAPRFFVEGGVGIHLLSSTRINNDRMFGTAFQFGEQVGLGLAFGPDYAYELGVYVQHVSNADIKQPNDGLTYPGIVFRAVLR